MQELPLDPDSFREVASRLAAGVVVITTKADGFDHAMTATSFTTVSLEPMRVLVCVEGDTRFHDALIPPGTSGVGAAWGVSILAETDVPAASWFSTKGRPLHGQFDRFAHVRSEQSGVVLLTSALACLEVVTVEARPVGDHSVVIGEVSGLAAGDPETHGAQTPLTYWARRYRQIAATPA